jgi:dihydropyrimidine dehydrogenase (NAD+) subunit PreT
MEKGLHPFTRGAPTGKRVAVVGAGPAGLSCAHRLAMHGHDVVVLERRPKAGGLNEYGIASYKATGGFAQKEVDWLMQIGGIEIRTGVELGRDVSLRTLEADYDAVFLGIGLAGVNALRAAGEDKVGVRDAVDFIAELRQSPDLTKLPVGRDVVVIGGGMTAVDAAVQSKLLGAENVTIVYRRGQEKMSASGHEQDHAVQTGVRIVHNAAPVAVLGNGHAEAVAFAYTVDGPNGLTLSSETFTLKADQVFKAIGQTLSGAPEGVAVAGGKFAGPSGKVWVGGDCAAGGEDLTVTAVAEGRDAAEAIHAALSGR